MAAWGRQRRQAGNFHTIRTELLWSRRYFVDRDFVAGPGILCEEDRNSGNIVWKRAKDICRNPRFVLDGIQRHDLDQGFIGNCWFVAAAATLAIGEKSRFERVVPFDQDFGQNYAGIFHFNFWWYGRWTEVIIDDFLPTKRGNLIYCSNTEFPNEFWPALLEKAYAKLHGSYQALDGGYARDALVDLTGGICEVIDISNKANIPPDLYNIIKGSHAMDSMQVAAVLPSGATREAGRLNGLLEGHEYSITKFHRLKLGPETIELVRLRNPWGRKEWTGPWSDDSLEMRTLPHHAKVKMDARIKNEGEFWMSFQDVLQNFDEIQLCHLRVDLDRQFEELGLTANKRRWNVREHEGAWTRGDTAGGRPESHSQTFWKNPQFYVELTQPDTVNSREGKCTLIVSLMQLPGSQNALSIGFTIYKLKRPDQRPLDENSVSRNTSRKTYDSGPSDHVRDITRRFELRPGHYIIIPSTSRPNQEAQFLLRLFTEKPATSRVLGGKDARRH